MWLSEQQLMTIILSHWIATRLGTRANSSAVIGNLGPFFCPRSSPRFLELPLVSYMQLLGSLGKYTAKVQSPR